MTDQTPSGRHGLLGGTITVKLMSGGGGVVSQPLKFVNFDTRRIQSFPTCTLSLGRSNVIYVRMHISVVKPKLFVCAVAPTFKKFRLRHQLVNTFSDRFHIKKWIFHVLMKEYQTNSHAAFYAI
jgi:hypothetical protein